MNDTQGCPDREDCEAVDVALDVALEAAGDPDVRQYIRRAQHARVAAKEAGRDD